jgi:hypothetical protein
LIPRRARPALTHVEQHLHFSPNTHLTGEALRASWASRCRIAASRRWAETDAGCLEEIDRQILADGGHVERSTHYQRYTLDFYLMALLTARRDGDADAGRRFTDAVTRLAEFTRTIADDAGRLPLIGDDDGGMLWPLAGRQCHDVRDSLALAAAVLNRPDLAPWGVQEEVLWITGDMAIDRAPPDEPPHAAARSLPSRALTDTGYVVAATPQAVTRYSTRVTRLSERRPRPRGCARHHADAGTPAIAHDPGTSTQRWIGGCAIPAQQHEP